MPDLFDFVKSINNKTPDMSGDLTGYNSFMVNRTMSLYPDTILDAYQMTTRHGLANDEHYAYLMVSVSKRARFAKFPKAEKSEHLNLICDHYGVNEMRGSEMLKLLSDQDIQEIKKTTAFGGFDSTVKPKGKK